MGNINACCESSENMTPASQTAPGQVSANKKSTMFAKKADKTTLTYFKAYGRAECIRMLLEYHMKENWIGDLYFDERLDQS